MQGKLYTPVDDEVEGARRVAQTEHHASRRQARFHRAAGEPDDRPVVQLSEERQALQDTSCATLGKRGSVVGEADIHVWNYYGTVKPALDPDQINRCVATQAH